MRVLAAVALMTGILGSQAAMGQTIDGNVVGAIYDASGAVVPNATVDLLNQSTGIKSTVKSAADGTYRFNNVPIGSYTVSANGSDSTAGGLKDLAVELNKTATANVFLHLPTLSTSVDVTEAAVALDTTTGQITTTYNQTLASELTMAASSTYGVLNLALLSAGVASSGGVGAGIGPSVGGQRPRNNTFTIEGADNNRKDITGPVAFIPIDGVAEFTVLQNQFSAEFGRSAGGQFNTVVKNGTNELHGSLYEYFQNRNLDAVDASVVHQGLRSNPRYDYNRFGGAVGGPAIKNKLFYYGLLEYNPVGYAATPSLGTLAPTAEGYNALAAIPGVSQTNLGVLKQYLPAAASTSQTTKVGAVTIPLGVTPIVAPSYYNYADWLASVDYNISATDQLRGRYISNHLNQIDTAANLPVFYSPRLTDSRVASLSEFHTFSANLLNELRLAYNRFDSNTTIPNAAYPGLSAFPNLVIGELNGMQLGPDPTGPQANIQNIYQLSDNLSWVKGKHDLKFGFDARDMIAGSTFVQFQRGDYEYNTLQPFLFDQAPDFVAQRAAGTKPYSGNSTAYAAFVNDNWRISRNLSVTLGLRYEFNGISQSMREFELNNIADSPGVLTFFAPQAQKANFAPRFGFAYSPGHSARTTIRGGFGIGYDAPFDNIGLNIRPPQATSVNKTPTNLTNFLAQGGLSGAALPLNANIAQIRAATTGWLPNQMLGYAETWNLGVEHQFAKDYTLEVRYLGTRGVHLVTQTELNRLAAVTPSNALPTYLQRPSQATLDSLTSTLAQLKLIPINPLAPYGFTNTITTYEPNGNSFYHGLAMELKKRMSRNVLFQAAYTWSHAMDDSTAEINTTALSPRRPQDFSNLASEWATSALDRRHRVAITWLYQTPWFSKDKNWMKRSVLGGYQLSGSYIAESPEYVTPQSVTDSNLNADATADRTIVNPGGVPGTGSAVTALKSTAGQTVAYLANNPAAEYIVAGQGALANAGRNTLATPRINNWDITMSKNLTFHERMKLQIRADLFNAFNHPQYTPGAIDNVSRVDRTSTTTPLGYLTPGNALFGRWDQIYGSNSRMVQLAARLTF
ncbi:MAG TPA: carboxypeptidase regulatory-like domain-containing protein [Bryobacteraceae bacterium]|jgi:hypothetical protein